MYEYGSVVVEEEIWVGFGVFGEHLIWRFDCVHRYLFDACMVLRLFWVDDEICFFVMEHFARGLSVCGDAFGVGGVLVASADEGLLLGGRLVMYRCVGVVLGFLLIISGVYVSDEVFEARREGVYSVLFVVFPIERVFGSLLVELFSDGRMFWLLVSGSLVEILFGRIAISRRHEGTIEGRGFIE